MPRRVLWIAAVAQLVALAGLVWLPMPYGRYVQQTGVLVSLAVWGPWLIWQLIGGLRRYREIRRRQRQQEQAFRRFVKANTATPNRP